MLTKRQQEIWEFLVAYVDDHGYPPTVREIGEQVGLASPSTVHAHLANLERAGLIKRDPTKPRALELTGRVKPETVEHEGGPVHALPLLGQIAAGGPLLAEQNVDAYLSVPEPLSRGGEEFLLRVRGDSMQDAGILEGDYVVVRRQQDARDGDIVVALVGDDESADEATVKRFFRDGPAGSKDSRVRLQPENQALRADLREPRPDPRQGDRGVPLAVTGLPSVSIVTGINIVGPSTARSTRSWSRSSAAPAWSAPSAASSCCTAPTGSAVRSAGSSSRARRSRPSA